MGWVGNTVMGVAVGQELESWEASVIVLRVFVWFSFVISEV